MPFSSVRAQETATSTLVRALRAGKVHHAYRFEGPDGVGKELAAFALAQALVCTGGDPLGCGSCSACKRAVALSLEKPRTPLHPDVVILERGLYPAEAIGRSRQESTELSVDQIRRLVLQNACFPPHEGRARVFIVRRADELSVSAANAFLKTLEEPRPNVHFVLLTSRAERLIDTIRSRSLPIRFGPLPDEVLADILAARGIPEARRALAIELAAGSAQTAIDIADGELTAARDEFVSAVLAAVGAADLGPAIAIAEAKDKDKAELQRDLRTLGAALARAARAEVATAPAAAAIAARRYDAVARAVQNLERNASPNLTLIALFAEMRDGRAWLPAVEQPRHG